MNTATQFNNNWYKVATKDQYPWIRSEVAVFKRVGPFNWQELNVEFESVEDAVEYIKFAEMV